VHFGIRVLFDESKNAAAAADLDVVTVGSHTQDAQSSIEWTVDIECQH
jgi:hypothetical protein